MHLTQLAKDLTTEIIDKENGMLQSVPFTVTGFGDSSAFTALTWYTDEPCKEDELYKVL